MFTTLDSLLEKEKQSNLPNSSTTLTEAEERFLFYYRKHLPVVDSDCVMNKICKYIEDTDFHIKQKVRSSQDFNYKILLSDENFSINKKIYQDIYNTVTKTFKEWEEILKNREKANYDSSQLIQGAGNKTDKDFRTLALKRELEQITSNEEELANHLVYLFYVGKPSYGKATMWNLVGKQIYENILKRTEFVCYPVKDVNGDIEFLYDKYSIRHVSTKNLQPHKYIFNTYVLGDEIFENEDENDCEIKNKNELITCAKFFNNKSVNFDRNFKLIKYTKQELKQDAAHISQEQNLAHVSQEQNLAHVNQEQKQNPANITPQEREVV